MKCAECGHDLAVYAHRCCACRREALERVLFHYTTANGVLTRTEVGWGSQPRGHQRCVNAIARDGDGYRTGVSFSTTDP